MAIRQAVRAPRQNCLVVIALGGIALLSAATPARPDAANSGLANSGFMNFPAIVETVKESVIGIDANAVDPEVGRLHRSAVSEDDEASPSRPDRGSPDQGSRGRQRHEVVGSGFLISSDGYAVTNAHVVAGSDSTRIKTTDGKTYSAAIVGIDSTSDVALV
jgi:S1-C subfamily serine protease